MPTLDFHDRLYSLDKLRRDIRMYSIKFDEEKELIGKLLKHQLKELKKAKDVDDLDDVIRPFIVLGDCIKELLNADDDENISTFYEIVSKEDWNGLHILCREIQNK